MDKQKHLTIDGNTAVANMAYMMSDLALIYPITPSSPMAENIDAYGVKGKKNIFGNIVEVTEMQSEAGAAGALHGALTAGSRATTFTSSQGLLLMIPNMYKIAGELLPCVIHVAARTVATHALSIFGDHSDVMGVRQTGFAMVASSSVQEAQDMALACHLATVNAKVPFLHFFDGFRTSHEVNTINFIEDETVKSLAEKQGNIYSRSAEFSPSNPIQRGTNQGEDIYFQNREACNKYYSAVPKIFEKVLADLYEATGRKYKNFEYYGAKDAESVIVCMGSGADTVIEAVEALTKQGYKVGTIKVRLYRPFDSSKFVSLLPKTTKVISVLDRTKECGAAFEPLAEDVISALNECNTNIKVLGGRYGLSSKEFTCNHVVSVYENSVSNRPLVHFTVGIVDDVTKLSLPINKIQLELSRKGLVECRFYGLGSDGTVSANKNSIKIISDQAGLYGQGYFVYDSKKSGGLTISHLRMSDKPINMPYLTIHPNFVACHNKSYLNKYDMLSDIKDGGTFLLNAPWSDEELENNLPALVKKLIASKHLKFFIIDAESVAEEVGLNRRINVVMQTAFFALSGILDVNVAIEHIKNAARKTYASKGPDVIEKNIRAINRSLSNLREVKYPAAWEKVVVNHDNYILSDDPYYKDYIRPIEKKLGDSLPVSRFDVSGMSHTGTSALEKRNTSTTLPLWIKENCIQCNQCALVCPHAVIRPYLIKSDSKLAKDVEAIPAIGVPGYSFKIQISPADCTGCENCARVCPALNKALKMVKNEDIYEREAKLYEMLKDIENVKTVFKRESIKGSQFEKPLFEFPGACAGCGETPYIKLLTQLFGEEMIVANATGCSSIYSGTAPTCPYTKTKDGFGPAWSNSLFEDNAEFGLGMKKSVDNVRAHLTEVVKKAIDSKIYNKTLTDKLKLWLSQDKKDRALASDIKASIMELFKLDSTQEITRALYGYMSGLFETSVWIIGGDGWAYDIGFGGLDHVLASGADVNILVLDTEVYSNTGGQASKATPMGSVAKFAESGKKTQKKDLGAMARQYPNVYVAQVAMGANPQATINALCEAKNHKGPSIVICYCPCINHGSNMSESQAQEKLAVETGYWPIYRYNPETDTLTFDEKMPTKEYEEFTGTQSRYFSLFVKDEKESLRLIDGAKKHAEQVIEHLSEEANKHKQ